MITENRSPKSIREILYQDCVPSPECIRAVEDAAVECAYGKGEIILGQGDLCDSIYMVGQGLLRVSNISDGQEDTVLFGTSGDVFTSIHSLYAAQPSVFTLSAVVDSRVWELSYRKLRRLSEEFPELKEWLHNLLTGQLYGLEKRYLFFRCTSAEERFLNFIGLNTGSLRKTTVKYITSTVPLKYIAQYLKINPSTLSRLRRKYANL